MADAVSVGAMYEAVAAGELWLEDGVGQSCAAHCQELIDELDRRADAVGRLARSSGFGEFASAKELQAGFERKASLAQAQLIEFRSIAERMRDTFLAADRSYTASSDSHAQQIGTAGGDFA